MCSQAEPGGRGAAEPAPLTGGRFALASLGFFTGPLALAILAGALAPAREPARTLSVLAGLLAGMAISIVLARRFSRSLKDPQ